MSAPIAYDVARLLLGALAVTPRGIDRVDFRYARFFFETWPGDCSGTLPTPWGVRRFDRRRVLQGLDRLEQLWSETVQSHEDPVLARIKGRLSGRHDPQTESSRGHDRAVISPASRILELLAVAGFSFGVSVVRAVPKNAIYVNVGQVGLAIPRIVSWLRHRPDVKSVFMLHDVIPLERPELVSSKDQRRHRRIVDRTARYASGLIASTETARDAVLKALSLRGRSTIPVEAVPLPVAPVFLEKDGPDQELREQDYFVVCGTIEPRKNHHLLLNVWRELVRRTRPARPKARHCRIAWLERRVGAGRAGTMPATPRSSNPRARFVEPGTPSAHRACEGSADALLRRRVWSTYYRSAGGRNAGHSIRSPRASGGRRRSSSLSRPYRSSGLACRHLYVRRWKHDNVRNSQACRRIPANDLGRIFYSDRTFSQNF